MRVPIPKLKWEDGRMEGLHASKESYEFYNGSGQQNAVMAPSTSYFSEVDSFLQISQTQGTHVNYN